jgi:hypothetical protein
MYRVLLLCGFLLSIAPTLAVGQSTEFSRRLAGTVDVSAAGQVQTYTLQSAGVPAIDQSLGNLVESWIFKPQTGIAPKPVRAEFQITLVRASSEDRNYTVKRVEFFPENARITVRGASSAEEMAYCKQPDAAPRRDVICPAVLPSNADLAAMAVSGEAYIALRKTDGGAESALESLSLYGSQNTKLLNKAAALAKKEFAAAALAWGQKNAAAFLQDRDYFVTRVEFVQSNNRAAWRRQEKADVPAIDWLTQAVRARTVYVSQGGLELK